MCSFKWICAGVKCGLLVTTDFAVRTNVTYVRSARDYESLKVWMQLNSCRRLHPVLITCNLVHTNTVRVVAVQVKRFFLMTNICCCTVFFESIFSFFLSSLHLSSDGNNITQVETADSFVEFLTSHMEFWRIHYPCLQPNPGQPGYKVCLGLGLGGLGPWSWLWLWQSVVLWKHCQTTKYSLYRQLI